MSPVIARAANRFCRDYTPKNPYLGADRFPPANKTVTFSDSTSCDFSKTGRIETAQEWLGHSGTAHTRAYIDAEDYREKANGVVAELDI